MATRDGNRAPRESRVRHAPSGPCTRLDTTRWVCRWGSPARESQWSNAAATIPLVRSWTTPPAPVRVRIVSASMVATTWPIASWWAASTCSRTP